MTDEATITFTEQELDLLAFLLSYYIGDSQSLTNAERTMAKVLAALEHMEGGASA